MFWYFGFIEFLQLSQYLVADQCETTLNKALTYAAYVHIAFQPLVVNNYFWSGFKHARPDLVTFIMRMCIFGGIMMLNRLPGMPLGMLGDRIHTIIPDFPPSSMGGQACHYLESSCSPKMCSVTGGGLGHISWAVPLLPSTYFIPGASMHAFLFFVPTILMGAGLRRYLMFITLGAGPLLSMWLSKADMSTYPLEWPTIWCFFAAVQTIIAFVFETTWPDAFSAPAPAAPKAMNGANGVHANGRAAQAVNGKHL